LDGFVIPLIFNIVLEYAIPPTKTSRGTLSPSHKRKITAHGDVIDVFVAEIEVKVIELDVK